MQSRSRVCPRRAELRPLRRIPSLRSTIPSATQPHALTTYSPPSRSSHVASTDLGDLVPANSLRAAKCRAASRIQSNPGFCRANDRRASFVRHLRATRSPNLFTIGRNSRSLWPEYASRYGWGSTRARWWWGRSVTTCAWTTPRRETTVGLAARMEQMADSGKALLTEQLKPQGLESVSRI
jgi:hypothetical protein